MEAVTKDYREQCKIQWRAQLVKELTGTLSLIHAHNWSTLYLHTSSPITITYPPSDVVYLGISNEIYFDFGPLYLLCFITCVYNEQSSYLLPLVLKSSGSEREKKSLCSSSHRPLNLNL